MNFSYYRISGLLVASEIVLAGIRETLPTKAEPDVIVRRGAVPLALDKPALSGPNWTMAENSFLLSIPRIARLRVNNGQEIVVETESSEADAVPFLLGTGFGILLHQRGTLVLHASAVSFDERAIALCGPRGVGKSTLSAALCQAGCGFISDDVSAVNFESNGNPVVFPDSRRHRLWGDAIERLSLSEYKGKAVRETIEKYHVEPGCFVDSMPLSSILILREARFRNQKATIEPLSLTDAAAMLRTVVHRHKLAAAMGLNAALFGQIGKVLGRVHVHLLTRPKEPERLDETVALLRKHVFGKM
ncbi:MAG: hypothetical protein WAW41_00725 [Methylobacter sp.]